MAVGDTLTVEAFNDVDKVDVIGVSKGKGFAGVIKRYGFAGGPVAMVTTSTAPPVRWACALYPARVLKGLRLPGHMGCDRVTVRNLKLVRVDEENNLMLVKGAVPGGKGALVQIRMA